MGENSAISWTDNTFNPWIGCTKVSAGCQFCYADRENKFYNWNPAGWGPQADRKRTGKANWKKPLQWDRMAAKDGVRRRVFCASLADILDDHPSISPEWRAELWEMAEQTTNLDWLFLSKRVENAATMLPERWERNGLPDNVWFGTSIEDQPTADKRVRELLKVKARIRFLSIEPLLGPVDLSKYLDPLTVEYLGSGGNIGWHVTEWKPIHWVIVGGESGTDARPMHPAWIRSLRDQCVSAGVPFHFKQWGEWAPAYELDDHPELQARILLGEVQRHEFPEGIGGERESYRVGKPKAGRKLDGRTWDEFPAQRED